MDEHSRNFGHVPVLMAEAVSALSAVDGGVYVDATLGGGGYTRAILGSAQGQVIAFDRDMTAIEHALPWARGYGGRLALVHSPFAALETGLEGLGIDAVDGVVFDLGVSSVQLDKAERGFSFMRDGVLDMRMDTTHGRSAARLVNEASEEDLADIFYLYGEERRSRHAAKAIVHARQEVEIRTTGQLADIVEKSFGRRSKDKTHPATRVFQAIRIFINDELGQLVKGLLAAERLLRPTGRLVVVTFHSIEDRIVKRFFAPKDISGSNSRHLPPQEKSSAPLTFSLLQRKAVAPSESEVAGNPRARSSKLRVGIRTAEPPRQLTDEFLRGLGVPDLKLTPMMSNWRE